MKINPRAWCLVVAAAALSPSWANAAAMGRIAYTCSGKVCVYTISPASTLQTNVSGVNPKFSPDGSLITYQSNGVWVMNSNGTNPRLLSSVGGVPSFSPDGQKIVFHGSSGGLSVINIDGTGLTQLTTHGRQGAFSPDGTKIAFSSDLGSPDSEIWTVNADGTGAQKVLTRAGADIDVVWLRSSKILFAGYTDRTKDYEIFSFDPNAPVSLARLTTSAKQDFEPSWSPDASGIAFASFRGPTGIYVANYDGSVPILTISGGRQPSWGP